MPMKTNEREYRDFKFTAEGVEDKKTVKGYASTFNQPYTLYSDDTLEIREVIDAHAFDGADMSDVILQYNHEGRVFARTSNGTLTVSIDENGLAVSADLGGTEIGRELYDEIKGGYTTKMSFGFKVDADRWEDREENGKTLSTRYITGVKKVFDVSAVSIPANDGTSISVRNLTDGVIEKVSAERRKALEFKKKKLLLIH